MCHSTLLLQPFIPANSPLTISSFTSRPHPTGYQQLLFMEPTKFTHQPELSLIDVHKRKEEVGGSAAESEDNVMSKSVRAPTDPVLTQPGLGTTSTTITTITQTGGDWSSSLFDACGDKTTCILGALVPCCLDLSLAHQFGECLCLPLLPGSTFAMRVGIRERYKIQQGSVCEDWTTVYCCYPLAVCQMIREMKRRMKTQTYHVATTLQCS
ncbi:cornifelin isoform X3 [Takifugu flavidus]|uniref:cornifelin isoform X3 n=1 Tax=Takifugu flavidus TaxID=433684 RepID=UPI0025443271|nr:cornifelin isoform X3 [Takifugu flavidus]